MQARFLAILFSNLLILLLGILLIEYIFGNWRGLRGPDRLNVPQDVMIYKDIAHLYPHAEKEILYKRDRNGLRGPFEKIQDVDIVTLGGSTTDQSEINEGETWQDVLAAEFSKNGKSVQIANAGINGQSAIAHARSLKIWLSHIQGLKPRYVLVYLGINDACFNVAMFKHFLNEENDWKTLWVKRSALFYLYRTLQGIIMRKSRETYEVSSEMGIDPDFKLTDKRLAGDPETEFRKELDSYEERLRYLRRRIREFGAEPVFVTQEDYIFRNEKGDILGGAESFDCWGKKVNGKDLYYILDAVNRRTLEFCRKKNMTCFDLAGDMDFKVEDFYDYEHNTPSGSRKIGEYLYGRLKDKIHTDEGEMHRQP